MTDHHKRRITIPQSLWDSLDEYSRDERLKVPIELADSITIESSLLGIVKKKMVETGHYPAKQRTSASRPMNWIEAEELKQRKQP